MCIFVCFEIDGCLDVEFILRNYKNKPKTRLTRFVVRFQLITNDEINEYGTIAVWCGVVVVVAVTVAAAAVVRFKCIHETQSGVACVSFRFSYCCCVFCFRSGFGVRMRSGFQMHTVDKVTSMCVDRIRCCVPAALHWLHVQYTRARHM